MYRAWPSTHGGGCGPSALELGLLLTKKLRLQQEGDLEQDPGITITESRTACLRALAMGRKGSSSHDTPFGDLSNVPRALRGPEV